MMAINGYVCYGQQNGTCGFLHKNLRSALRCLGRHIDSQDILKRIQDREICYLRDDGILYLDPYGHVPATRETGCGIAVMQFFRDRF